MSSIQSLMQQISQIAPSATPRGSTKTASSDRIPTEGHPTDSFDDRATITHGPEISESGEEQKDQYGSMAGASEGRVNPEEDEPTTIGTELNHGGDTADPALKPGVGVDDPGPDSEHPASPNNKAHKYASINDPVALAESLQAGAVAILTKLAADPSLLDEPLRRSSAKQAAAPESGDSLVDAIRGLLPTEALISGATNKIASLYAPYVAEGIHRANTVYQYLSLVDQNPKLAADMMGLPPEAAEAGGADPMAGGEDPMGGGMPPEDGGDPMGGGMPPEAGGGEGDMLDELLSLMEQVAEQTGVPVEALAQELASMLGGEGGEGGDPMGGGMPPEAGGDPMGGGMPPEAGGEDPMAGGMPPEKTAGVKTAAARAKVASASKNNVRAVAKALLSELASAQ